MGEYFRCPCGSDLFRISNPDPSGRQYREDDAYTCAGCGREYGDERKET